MAIHFARPRFIQRSKGQNVVAVAGYNMRERLYCEKTGELTRKPRDPGSLVHHEIMLPAGADARFAEAGALWNTVQVAERRKDSQEAFEVVLPLPADPEITADDRLALARSFAKEHFVSKGLAVQIDIHRPDPRNADSVNHHAHLLVTTRRIEGDQLSWLKSKELHPRVRRLPFGKPVVVEGELWGNAWARHQDKWFGAHGKTLMVDPVAPVPQQHIGPKRFRHPNDPRIEANAQLQTLNSAISRDPAAAARHLHDQRRPLDQRALSRFLTKHIPDPQERASVQADVETRLHNLRRAALEKATFTDMVPSGWRQLFVEDIARELSPEYRKLANEAAALRKKADKWDRIRDRNDSGIAEAQGRQTQRWNTLSFARRALHTVGAAVEILQNNRRTTNILTDIELKQLAIYQQRREFGKQRAAIKRTAALDLLAAVDRLAGAELEKVRPAAEQELRRRQQIAHNAREGLKTLTKEDNILRQKRGLTLSPRP